MKEESISLTIHEPKRIDMKKLILLMFLLLPLAAQAQKQVKIDNPYIIMGTDNDMLNMMMMSEATPDSLKTLWEGLELDEPLIIAYDDKTFKIKTPIDPETKTHQKLGRKTQIVRHSTKEHSSR